jgi:hypothetical protein
VAVTVSALVAKADRYPHAFVVRFSLDTLHGDDECGNTDDSLADGKSEGAKHALKQHKSRGLPKRSSTVVPINSVHINAQDEGSMRTWIASIESMAAAAAAERTGNSAQHAPLWRPDSADGSCEHCSTDFTITRRRHHCRLCGALVCDKCSPHRWLLQEIDRQ